VFNSFRDGMRDLGYVEGRNLVIEQRWANGNYGDLPRLAQELVDLKVDVIFATCTPCTEAVLRASRTIPIVTVSGDPLKMGFVASLSRPGGNVTGLTLTLDEISVKRLELLKEAAPSVSVVAVLATGGNPIWERIIGRMKPVARTLGMSIEPVKAAGSSQIAEALDAIATRRPHALYVFEDPVLRGQSQQIVAFAAKQGVPAIYGGADFVRNGGLISYGASFDDLFRRAAKYVAQILGGANPAEMPMQQPTEYELALNLKTAKTLGLKIPESILLRATAVIR
jgi:putative ABC transport system substrate-binding protein